MTTGLELSKMMNKLNSRLAEKKLNEDNLANESTKIVVEEVKSESIDTPKFTIDQEVELDWDGPCKAKVKSCDSGKVILTRDNDDELEITEDELEKSIKENECNKTKKNESDADELEDENEVQCSECDLKKIMDELEESKLDESLLSKVKKVFNQYSMLSK